MSEQAEGRASEATASDAYARLIGLLDGHGARYRLLDHAPEGRTEVVSQLRGHPVAQAAKCVVLLVKMGKKVTKYVLAVVPGDARVDFAAVKRLFDATYVGFADTTLAERLAGTVSGTILPFSFNPSLELVADPGVLEPEQVYFNAARLDRSLALGTAEYRMLARPRLAAIAVRT